jgi:hypothetical protein
MAGAGKSGPHRVDLDWARAVRIIPSIYPPIGLFEDVADPDELEAVFAVEAITNPRLQSQVGNLGLIGENDRISGPGTTPIMAAFTHPNADGSRFSDGSFGVYYAARTERTAIEESAHHRAALMRFQNIGPQDLQMRAYWGRIKARMVELRGLREMRAELYDPDHYAASQAFGVECKQALEWGVCYESVRKKGGECVAVFRPPACRPVRQGAHFQYRYDGKRISAISRLIKVR